jgi:hypothetical protein
MISPARVSGESGLFAKILERIPPSLTRVRVLRWHRQPEPLQYFASHTKSSAREFNMRDRIGGHG